MTNIDPRDEGYVWGTWKTHGNAEELEFAGQNSKAPECDPGKPMIVKMAKGDMKGRWTAQKQDGTYAAVGFNATRFWARPVQEQPEQEDLQNAVGAKAQRPVIVVGTKFYRVRANGTKRHVPTLAGEDLALAETVRGKREAGATMRQLSDEMHLSVSTLRRLLGSLALTEQVAQQSAAN